MSNAQLISDGPVHVIVQLRHWIFPSVVQISEN